MVKILEAKRPSENDSDGVIEDALAENECVEVDVDMKLGKDGQDGHRISGRNDGTKVQRVQERKVFSQIGKYLDETPNQRPA